MHTILQGHLLNLGAEQSWKGSPEHWLGAFTYFDLRGLEILITNPKLLIRHLGWASRGRTTYI